MKRWIALLTALVLALSLCGCSEAQPEEESTTKKTTTTTAATTVTTEAVKKDYNFLTGEQSLPEGASGRPVAVMIANDAKARPQRGISQADLFVEAETEGGIPRVMAVFASKESLPKEFGPIRSARTHFVRMADALDAVLIHAGGSPKAKALIKSSQMPVLDFCGADGSAFWRDSALRKKNGLDHSLVSSRAKAIARIEKKGLRQETTVKAPFAFGSVSGSKAAGTVTVKLSASQNARFTYDSKRNVYLKETGRNTISAHKDEDGTQIYASNVIVMYARRFNEDSSHVTFELGSGKALLATGGKAREIRWSRTDSQLSFTETDGSAAQLATGKTYICLISSSYESNTKCS